MKSFFLLTAICVICGTLFVKMPLKAEVCHYLVVVNLGDQYLEVLKNGRRILRAPVATASGKYFHSLDGSWKKAVTPTGVFRIWKKIPGWHRSYLGGMYDSMYITHDGVALHGGPLNKRSHGCIHLAEKVSRYLFYLLPVGTKVEIIKS
jgi:lipoprotein-anchoring transpeptidase ErfK/SrfK